MAKRDYYEVLGITKSANADEIKSAYRGLAKKFHTDVNKEKTAEEKFKEINEAYEVLSDPQKRQLYDQYGHAGVGSGGAGGFGEGGFSDFSGFGDINDIFGDVFENIFTGGNPRSGSRRRSASGATRGEDLQVRLSVTLVEAYHGTQKTVRINHSKSCTTCSGSGAKPGTTAKTCTQCKGSGTVHLRQGFFSLSQTCPKCKGAGKSIDTPCVDCDGHGRTRSTDPITVKIPAGVQEGTALRVNGAGEAGLQGGQSGDLYVVIHMESDPKYERHDDDIWIEEKISITQASLGSTIKVPSLAGEVSLKIPPGTQTGTVFRIREKGMPHLSGRGQGDQLVKIFVQVPTELNDEQKSLLEQLSISLGEEKTISEDGSFIKKMFKKKSSN